METKDFEMTFKTPTTKKLYLEPVEWGTILAKLECDRKKAIDDGEIHKAHIFQRMLSNISMQLEAQP